jgi:hypothetical protein
MAQTKYMRVPPGDLPTNYVLLLQLAEVWYLYSLAAVSLRLP